MSAEVPIFQAEQSVNPGEVQTDSQEEPLLQEEGEVTLVDSIPSDDKLSSSTSRPLDEVRRAAADSIEPGCKQWTLADWKPKMSKPFLKHLKAEIEARGYQAKGCWSPQQCADFLLKTPKKVVETLHSTETTVSEHESRLAEGDDQHGQIPCAPAMPAASNPPVAAVPSRWFAHRHGCRLLHVLCDMKEEFLKRDEGHLSRNEKDGAAKNSFWLKAALKFNDVGFKPQLIKSKDEMVQSTLDQAKLDSSYTQFEGEMKELN